MSSIARTIVTISIALSVTGVWAVPQASAGKLSRVRSKTDKQKEEKPERKAAPQPKAKPAPPKSPTRRSNPSKTVPRKSSRSAPMISFSKSSEGSQSRVAAVRSKPKARKKATPAQPKGKLAGISSNVRRNQPAVSRPSGPSHNRRPNAHRGNVAHHCQHTPRRPGRSPLRMGLHFGSGFGTPYAPAPSSYVVEEYYYGTCA